MQLLLHLVDDTSGNNIQILSLGIGTDRMKQYIIEENIHASGHGRKQEYSQLNNVYRSDYGLAGECRHNIGIYISEIQLVENNEKTGWITSGHMLGVSDNRPTVVRESQRCTDEMPP